MNITIEQLKTDKECGLTQRDMSKKYNVSEARISQLIKRYKIKKRHENYIDQKFGKLYVKEFVGTDKNYHPLFKCKCDCGNEKVIVGYALLTGNTLSCGCSHFKTGKYNNNYKGYEEIRGCMWSWLKKGAESRNLEFNITIEQAWELYLKQDRKCALTGLNIQFAEKRRIKFQNASLDRIDSKKGYTIDNVQWVHKRINKLKMGYKQEEFIDLCCLVAKYNKNKNF